MSKSTRRVRRKSTPRVRVEARELELTNSKHGLLAVAYKVVSGWGYFQVFERLNDASAYPGTGIGLAIVRRAVGRMGGKVGVQSEEGKGSRFWVDLPKAMAPVQPLAPESTGKAGARELS